MTESWHNFFFGAVDPNGWAGFDKLPGYIWPQAVSAAIFGFHPWALILPQAIEGIISVVLIYAIVRRWAGLHAALLAAGIFAFTPVTAALFGNQIEDAALICGLIVAAYGYQRAVDSGSLRWLIFCGVWIGIAFQAKMLQSWLVLPAFGLAYLLAAPVSAKKRWGQVGIAGAVAILVSLSYMLVTVIVPHGERPYLDGTTNDNAFSQVFGFNGFSRMGDIIHVPGAIVPLLGGFAEIEGSPVKLFWSSLGSQIGWLYPVALAGLVLGLLWGRASRKRTDPILAGLVMWGLWLVVTGLALSFGTLAHTAYVAALAPPIAALAGYGIVLLWREFRGGGPRAWALPVVLALTVAWGAYFTLSYSEFLPGFGVVVLVVGLVAVVLLGLAAARGGAEGSTTRYAFIVALVAILLPSVVWSASVVVPKYRGTVSEATAGPVRGVGFLPKGKDADTMREILHVIRPIFGTTTELTPQQRALLTYVRSQNSGEKFVTAIYPEVQALPFILAEKAPVLPMAGLSGRTHTPTADELSGLVARKELKFVYFADASVLGKLLPNPNTDAVKAWVTGNCTVVPPAEYGAPADQKPAIALYRCGG
ncbi:ArnT family glycosyltransferase [Micromonospora sp. DT233]|uniref:ArnT family glycosyltransferase n=1 Tax=Micromonospora sp. DT233 TaxID=3393432 RepID=UPI003CEC0E41